MGNSFVAGLYRSKLRTSTFALLRQNRAEVNWTALARCKFMAVALSQRCEQTKYISPSLKFHGRSHDVSTGIKSDRS